MSNPAVAYLYDPSRLEALASELNSAILGKCTCISDTSKLMVNCCIVSLGKSCSSSLENIYRQTNAVIDELVLMGDARAALFQPEKDCMHSVDIME